MLLARFDRPLDLPRAERVALLGGKGDGLMRMAGELGLPVPPGFILTTQACALYEERGFCAELEQALRTGISELEATTGRRFGGGASPLVVSVRSGAPESMPGMLDTLLNVGLDARATAAFAAGNPRLAAECRARLETSFREGLEAELPDDVWLQLRMAVEAVFRSTRSARAGAYRRREGLDVAPRTAVNVQTMVFGNRDLRSATGVYFTRDPATGENRPYGDILFQAQGEDVVAGRHATQPIATLEQTLPDIARSLFAIGRRLEHAYRDLCEIEFTIESCALWLLQVRVGKRSPRAALRIARELALDPDFPVDRREAVERVAEILVAPPECPTRRPTAGVSSQPAIARGLGASPGIATGEIATTVEGAIARVAEGAAVILVRPETSPEDVEGIAVATGLLTCRGGLASHAAVVARGWGIPAVVGLASLAIEGDGVVLGGRRYAVGEILSIDGTSGEVHAGALAVEENDLPEVAQLLGWARELGIALPEARPLQAKDVPAKAAVPAPAAAPAPVPESSAADETDVLAAILSIKGSATPEMLGAALTTSAAQVSRLLEELTAAGEIEPAKPIGLRLTESGKRRASRRLEHDRQALGADAAHAALGEFQSLDARMKEAVTDWQLRLAGTERIPNDHADAAWDADVRARLEALGDDAVAWLAPFVRSVPRLDRYARRLAAARAAVQSGDARFVASPRVDSLHGIWFELHEDLIRLAGSTRSAELAAGRSA